ncbi:unnamed protein product [Nezara viridula]|uniref:Peptidase A2 domain-containing protein n=1 Tax=Nezara viridula TaxID=85310 RepID=A0A9P0H4B2_NEZVI|nr:unnamed protein product [Nezara viridula]
MVIDPGSQINLITTDLVKKLRLRSRVSPLVVSGVARVLPCVSGSLPLFAVSQEVRNKFASIELADPQFYTPGKVDLLMGAVVYGEILNDPVLFLKGQPKAIHTSLGWTSPYLHEELKRFRETEEVTVSNPPNPEDVFCEDHFIITCTRDLQDFEMEAVKGAGNMGRGKDIANIVEVEKKASQTDETANVEEEPKPEDEEQGENWRPPVVPKNTPSYL